MMKQKFSIMINAPVQKVWDTMLSDASYRKRTSAFNPAWSRHEGDRSQGSKIRFMWPHPDDTTKIGGMYSEIKENRLYEYISIRHLGEIDGDTLQESAVWKWAEENYSFSEDNGVTTVNVDIDMTDEFAEYMSQARPKALATLKELCKHQ